MTSVLMNPVIGSLLSEVDDRIKNLKGLKDKSQSLQRELRMLIASRHDDLTSRRDAPRSAVAREYDAQIRELIQDIEDCIERFLHRCTCDKETGLAGRFHRAAHTLKTLGIRHRFAKDIDKLTQRSKNLHCSRQQNKATTGEPSAQTGHCLHMEERPVGIAKAKEDLLMLLGEVEGEAEKLRVISIVGFGGSGKTTLANAVYTSADAGRFPLRAWVRRSQDEDANGLLRKIIKEFWGEIH